MKKRKKSVKYSLTPVSSRSQLLASMGLGTLILLGSPKVLWSNEKLPMVLPEVVVSGNKKAGYTTQEPTLPKYTQPLVDTPQSVSVVPEPLMEDQAATTLREAVRNVAGISIGAGEGGFQGDNLTLRGFSARNDIFLDGMRDFGSYYRDTFNLESVEVLKGPASASFGRGSTGGVVNQVSKTPRARAFSEADVMIGSNGKNRVSIDVNEPIFEGETTTSFRLNAFQDHSNVAGRDVVETQHSGIAPSLAFGLGGDVRVNLSHLHEEADDIPDYGIPWLFHEPAPVNRRNYYGFKSNFLETKADISTARAEWDVNDNVTLRDQVRYGRYSRMMRTTSPRLDGSTTPATPLEDIIINRNQINTDGRETFFQNQLDLISHFDTGPLSHDLVTGLEFGNETSATTRFTITGVPTTNLLAPDFNDNFQGTYTAPRFTQVDLNTFGLFAVDTVSVGEHWEITGGFRWDHIHTAFSQNSTDLSSEDSAVSWKAAIVNKPVEDGSIYISYGSSFNPSSESLSLSSGTDTLDPERNNSYEAGTKWSLFNKLLSLRAALFRTEKTNARERDPNDSSSTVLAGNHRVDGFEIEALGEIAPWWQIALSFAHMQSKVVSSLFFPASVGEPLANVPQNTFSFWNTYTLFDGLEAGVGGNFVDARRASSTAPTDATTGQVKEVPSYWVFDAMVSKQITRNFRVQINLNNIFDAYYIDQVHPGHIVPGEGRTLLVSGRIDL